VSFGQPMARYKKPSAEGTNDRANFVLR
jgi:hypothetical protein